MHDKKSSFALNKIDPCAIVYPDGNHMVRVTEDDIKDPHDFQRLKQWSDTDYHIEENKDHVENNHSISLELLPEGALSSVGPETLLEQNHEKAQRSAEVIQKVSLIRSLLSEKQFHRLWMSSVDGMTEKEIALLEGTTQQAVSKSIMQSKKKIKKIFSQNEKKGL